jgi:hypothetical protein
MPTLKRTLNGMAAAKKIYFHISVSWQKTNETLHPGM